MPEWMIVYSTHDYTDAHIVAGRLQVEAIPAIVHRQPGASALGITIGALGEITVLVHPENYDEALLLLEPDELDALPDTTNDVTYLGVDHDAD